ncbi:hypothetical protein O7602_09380 [Micromonospora sp. WMMD1128]|uniref:hypothetical protein n=1 Tax=Micromonospora sp. WMMD1128 TaxID=3015150 RepID=UPI00248BB5E1|nr:hypothetical protein [Micromonospora sp. WMMD1128]WBB75693.1 hypothetical protein O7602_09380 [Micromonospora sp. WMMD1128]
MVGGLAKVAFGLPFQAQPGQQPDQLRIAQVLVVHRLERGDVRYRFVLDLADLDLPGNAPLSPAMPRKS